MTDDDRVELVSASVARWRQRPVPRLRGRGRGPSARPRGRAQADGRGRGPARATLLRALRRPGLDQRPLLGARRPALRLRALRASLTGIRTVAFGPRIRIRSAIRRCVDPCQSTGRAQYSRDGAPPGFPRRASRARLDRGRRRAKGDLGFAQDQRGARRLLGALSVPPGKDRVVPRRGGERPLPLLRLPRRRRRGELPARDRGPRVHGGGRAARRRGRDGDAGAAIRRPRRGRRRNQGLVEAMEAAVRFYRAQLNGARAAEARGYLDRRGMSAATRERFEIGYAPDGRTDLLGHLEAKGFAPRDAGRGRARRPAEGRRRGLRPLPQPDHVPDPRRPRPGDRLRRAGGQRRAGAEVPELAGDAALRQGPHALQPRAGARGGRQGRHARRHRGLHGRDRAGAGRARPCGRAARHRDHRGTSSRRSGSSRPSRWSRSTATPPGSPRRSG